jgi:hypothetical protein
MRKRLIGLLAAIGMAFAVVMVTAANAQAVGSKDFGPLTITGIPANANPALQLVVPLATIDSPQLAAGSTAYVYSELKASAADQVNLVDNEIRCSGAGKSDVVMGENVLPASGDPAHQNITILTRFLITATSPGVISCTLYLRTSSTSVHVAKETVQGTVRFASYSVPGDVNGVAMQKSLPVGGTALGSTVITPVLDRVVPAGYSKVDVVADMEFHLCADSQHCTQQFSKARFALTVTTSGGANCASAPVAQTDEYVQVGVNHAATPLYTTVTIQPGCTHLHAQVTGTYLSGNVGSIGGAAPGLTDATGHAGDTPNHTSVMTHMFALPRTS